MQGISILNEHLVLLLPAAVYALCAGCAPFTQCRTGLLQSNTFLDVTDAVNKVCVYSLCLYSLFFFIIKIHVSYKKFHYCRQKSLSTIVCMDYLTALWKFSPILVQVPALRY